MFRIGICEDDVFFSSQLESIITKKFLEYDIAFKVDCFNSGEYLIDCINKSIENYDVIFFDIGLPGLNGIDTARKIREISNDCIFIFVTSFDEKVYEALDLSIFHFIRKSHFKQEVEPILESLIDKLDYLLNKYSFPVGDNNIYLKINDIIYLEVLNRQVIIHTLENKHISNYRSLKEIPYNLEDNYFYEIYRGIVVNLYHVDNFIDGKVILSNKNVLYIARRRITDFKEKFFKYISLRRQS